MVEPLLNPSPITNLVSTACIKQTNKQITKDRKCNKSSFRFLSDYNLFNSNKRSTKLFIGLFVVYLTSLLVE